MNEKRLQQIMARKNEILAELDNMAELSVEEKEARMKEIETETAQLEAEERSLRAELDVRGRLTNVSEKSPAGATANEAEERANRFMETRALTIASGDVAVPTATQNDVNPMMGGQTILDLVEIADCKGMGGEKVPYEKPGFTAGTDSEGQATSDDFETAYAELKPITVDIYTEISREVAKLSPVKYLAAVEKAAVKALRKKIAGLIVTSNGGSNGFYGIEYAPAVATSVTVSAIGATTLRDIILSYGGDEDVEGAAVLVLNKKDLQAFGAVRGTNEKKAVYEIIPDIENPNTGIIKDGGLACRYSLNNSVTALADATTGDSVMYYGKPKAYKVDIFSDLTVTVSEEAALKTRMIAVLGEVMVGGNVVVYDGFIKVAKA